MSSRRTVYLTPNEAHFYEVLFRREGYHVVVLKEGSTLGAPQVRKGDT